MRFVFDTCVIPHHIFAAAAELTLTPSLIGIHTSDAAEPKRWSPPLSGDGERAEDVEAGLRR